MRQPFEIGKSQLRQLFEQPKEQAADSLRSRYGGSAGLAKALGVDPEKGLEADDPADLQARAEWFGANRVPIPKQRSLLLLMWDALHDVMLIVLMIAGLISLICGLAFSEERGTDWIEGAAILGAVLVVTLVSSINDYQKEKQFRKLNAVREDAKVNVFRGGMVVQVSKYDVVVGDIVILAQGDELVADGVVLDSSSLQTNESALTGESDDVKKDKDVAPILFSGTQVMEGVGRMLVLCVGENSQAGILHMLVTGQAKKASTTSAKNNVKAGRASSGSQTDNEVVDLDSSTAFSGLAGARQERKGVSFKESTTEPDAAAIPIGPASVDECFPAVTDVDSAQDNPAGAMGADDDEENATILQQKLGRLAIMVSYLGVAVGILTFIVMTIRFCIETYTERGWEGGDFQTLLDYFIIGITVLVVAIPEGLPLAVTLALAFSMTQMIKENNLVRHLDACETMGNATTICSDKTGTLTTNRMAVTKARIGSVETDGKPMAEHNVASDAVDVFVEGCAINSTAEVQRPASGVGPNDYLGNKTECALLQYIMDMGADYSAVRANHKPVHMIPFSSAKKRMSVVIPYGAGFRLHTKGASEIVLQLCDKVLTQDGTVQPMTPEMRNELMDVTENYARQSLRTLALAYRDMTPDDVNEPWDSMGDKLETGLTLAAIAGIEDPVRPEVPHAIKQCERAGITVRMVTGDNTTTARAVAVKCGILNEDRGDSVMDGPEFRKRVLDANGNIVQSEFDRIWPTLRVLARSSPTDKYTLVSGILHSQLGPDREVVAVTGDGTNDAPALKRADIGFAMGIQGTAVAKNASDIILMDDNFSSIVVALKWGRNIYDAISKFVQFQLTVNVAALVIAFTSAAVTRTTPLTAVQLLWINLIMDTLAALALATEKPTDRLLDRKPYGRNKSIISRRMWWFILMHALYQIGAIFFVLYAGPSLWDIPSGTTAGGAITVNYTMVFNTFVLCQLFNEINARKLHGEFNVFRGILDNWFFLAVMVVQVAGQILIIEFGGQAFKVTPLTWDKWGWCTLIAAGELLWNVIINALPIMIPKSWRVKMNQPLRKSWWAKSRRRFIDTMQATRPFRKTMKTAMARDGMNSPSRAEWAAEHADLLLTRAPSHPSFYESAWHVLLSSTRSPGLRFRAAVHIVQERIRIEHSNHYYQHDDLMHLKEHQH